MSDFDLIGMKFSMEVEFDALNDYPKFGSKQLISCPEGTPAKKFSQPITLVSMIKVDVGNCPMGLIFGQSVDKIAVESPIVIGGIKTRRCPVGEEGWGVLGIMSDFGPIDM